MTIQTEPDFIWYSKLNLALIPVEGENPIQNRNARKQRTGFTNKILINHDYYLDVQWK